MPDPLVSVIIPAFNAERFLPEALISVHAQTFQDWEAIVSDDGSTDATLRVARQFTENDSRILVVENPPARHPGPTRNAAIARARGKYLAFLDADDLWEPKKLEVQLEAIGKLERPGLCCSLATDFSDAPGPPVRGTHPNPPPNGRERQFAQTLLFSSQACTSSWMIERGFAEEIGPFTADPLLAGYEDWDYLLRALHRRPFVFIPERLVRYRVHAASITDSRANRWERRFEIYKQVEGRGEMPRHLRRPAYSSAWLVRAESELTAGQAGWRRSFLRALALHPSNIRRWPALMALALPRAAMQKAYDGLKRMAGA